ncbi:MAG: molecular chaperone Tir [Flavobacterium sp.]|nr:MAG: molecular chaperone Tir [Flavobacterium sp.]
MAHKCFISFKTQDHDYKRYIHDHLDVDMIDKSLHEPIDSEDEDYIMRKIRENYLSDSTVTIHLIGSSAAENSLLQNQTYIKRELQASLYHGVNNTKNGILGVVLPSMTNSIYLGSNICASCGGSHTIVSLNDQTVVKEFSYNYYIPNNKCSWSEDDRFCILTTWEDFSKTPNYYIDQAFDKRTHPISASTRVKP